MTATNASRPKTSNNALKKNPWPKVRLIATLLFFYFVGSILWNGTTCSVSFGAVGIACPLGVAQVMAAAEKFIPSLALAGLLGIGVVVLFGRAFCSWICPGRYVFNHLANKPSPPSKTHVWIQSALVTGVVGVAWLCHNPIFCVICPAGVACRGALAAGTGGSLLPTIGWMTALVGVEWASGLSFCRDLCPLGAGISRMSMLNPFLKVKANQEKCVPCTICEKACTESINLSRDTDLTTCTKCLDCQPACPRDAIEVKII
jgi:ferredoxin-type protein NapH